MLPSVIYTFIGMVVLSPESSLALKIQEVRVGAAVTLQCDLSNRYDINWLRMSWDMKPELLMVLGLKNNGDLSMAGNSDSSRFQGFFRKRLFQLRIERVTEEDLGLYFCVAVNDRNVEFGEATRLDAVSDVKQRPDRNLTHCRGYGDRKSEESGGHFYTHMIVSAVLNCGVLLMIFIVVAVHLLASQFGNL